MPVLLILKVGTDKNLVNQRGYMGYADPFRIEDVPSYDDLRKIEDWNNDRGKKVSEDYSESDLLQYSIEREMYSREDIVSKFFNPSDNPERGIELLNGNSGSLKWAQLLTSGFTGASAGAITGDWVSGYASFIGTYGLIEASIRSTGYLWMRGRDRDDIRNDHLAPYDQEKEDALEAMNP